MQDVTEVFRFLPSGLVMFERAATGWRIVAMSEGAREVVGFGPETNGRLISDFGTRHGVEELLTHLERAVEKRASQSFIVERQRPTPRVIRIQLDPLSDGSSARVVGLFERVGSGENARLLEQVSLANTELERFVDIVAHDLSGPLRSILGFGALVQEACLRQDSVAVDDYLERIMRNARNCAELIDVLHTYSKLQRDPVGTFGPVDLRHVVELAGQRVAEQGPFEWTCDELFEVGGNATRLQQVFVNLFENALKFRKPGQSARVHVTADHHADGAQVVVSDEGVGFDAKFATEVFDVFRRLPESANTPGTGMGLAIVKALVTQHNGTIVAHGEPGRGATFTMFFP